MIRPLLFSLALLDGTASRADDWPDFLGPKRRGISKETGWNDNWNSKEPPVLWRAEVGAGASSCTIVGGRLYTMGGEDSQEWVLCLDAATGKEIWRQTYECDFDKRSWSGGPAGTPVVDGDRVYTLSFRGQLYCWNAADGAKRWELNLDRDFKGVSPRWGWAGNPLVLGNMVIIEPGGNGSSRAAVDKLTGNLFWQTGNDSTAYGSPVIFSGPAMRGAALFNTSGLVCVNPRDGSELFRHEWRTNFGVNAPTPIHHDGKFVIASGYDRGMVQVDIKTGVVWEKRDIKLQFQSPVLYEDSLFFVSGDNSHPGKLQCLDWKTGEVRWTQSMRGNRGSVIVAGGKLLALSEEGELILADTSPAGCKERGRIQAVTGQTWAPPAFSDSRVYVRNNAGKLVCLDLKK